MEKNLSYGDVFNFFGTLFSNLVEANGIKKLDEKQKEE